MCKKIYQLQKLKPIKLKTSFPSKPSSGGSGSHDIFERGLNRKVHVSLVIIKADHVSLFLVSCHFDSEGKSSPGLLWS